MTFRKQIHRKFTQISSTFKYKSSNRYQRVTFVVESTTNNFVLLRFEILRQSDENVGLVFGNSKQCSSTRWVLNHSWMTEVEIYGNFCELSCVIVGELFSSLSLCARILGKVVKVVGIFVNFLKVFSEILRNSWGFLEFSGQFDLIVWDFLKLDCGFSLVFFLELFEFFFEVHEFNKVYAFSFEVLEFFRTLLNFLELHRIFLKLCLFRKPT
jgi:hypothetical protein